MKSFLFVFATLFLTTGVSAINFKGHISSNMTWTKANSPYTITGQVLVYPGVTLTIEPGVEVRFIQSEFWIQGTLYAVGTASDPIKLTSDVPFNKYGHWPSISLKENCDSAVFRHCQFTKLETPIQYAVTPACNLRLIIEQCHIKECAAVLIADGGNVYLRNNRIEDCTLGTHIAGHEVEITGNFIARITKGFLGSSSDSKKYIISNNYLMELNSGITVGGLATHLIENNVIIGCQQAGIEVFSGWANSAVGTIRNNIIAHNKNGLVINDLKPGPGLIISNNTIKHNKRGAIFRSWTPDIKIIYNCIDSNTEYNIATELKGHDIELSDNYWGNTDSTVIRKTISDYYKDSSYGKVLIMPVLAQPDSSCKGIGSWSPSPTSVKNSDRLATNKVIVLPNPTTSSFTIKTGDQRMTGVAIYNILGARLTVLSLSNTEATIDASSYPAGMYIYHVTFENNTTVTGKLEKQ
jgi:hypothetical protein